MHKKLALSNISSTIFIFLTAALTTACTGAGDDGSKMTTHVVDIEIAANGCPENPTPPTVNPGDTVRIQIAEDDSDADIVNKWAIAFTEGGLTCGCEVNNPENAFVCQIPTADEGPSRYCYSIFTKMSNTSYCELDPTIFVNRNLGGAPTRACEESTPLLSNLPPEVICDTGSVVDPDTWL